MAGQLAGDQLIVGQAGWRSAVASLAVAGGLKQKSLIILILKEKESLKLNAEWRKTNSVGIQVGPV